jgi:hypothetical protein
MAVTDGERQAVGLDHMTVVPADEDDEPEAADAGAVSE